MQNKGYWRAELALLAVLVLFGAAIFIPFTASAKEYSPSWDDDTGASVACTASAGDGSGFIAASGANLLYYKPEGSTPTWTYTFKPADILSSATVNSIAISRDGRYIAAGSASKEVSMFYKTGQTPIYTFTLAGNVTSVDVSSTGYAAAGASNNIYLLAANGFQSMLNTSITGAVTAVAISDDGKWVVAGTDKKDHKVILLQNSGGLVGSGLYSQVAAGITCVAISDDGKYFVAGASDGTIMFFGRSTQGLLIWSRKAGGAINDVDISYDGRYVAAGSEDGNMYYFDRDSDKLPLWVYSSESAIKSVAVSGNGYYAMCGDKSGNVAFFYREVALPVWTYLCPLYNPVPGIPGGILAKNAVNGVSMSGNGKYIFAGSANQRVYFFTLLFSVNTTVSPKSSGIDPGAEKNYNVTIKNTGDAHDIYDIMLSISNAWQASYPLAVMLGPGENVTVQMRLIAPDNAAAGSVQHAVLNVRSRNDQQTSAAAQFSIAVNQVYGVDLTCANNMRKVKRAESATFNVVVSNTGNGEDAVSLETSSAPFGWNTLLSKSVVVLRPGAKETVSLIVTAAADAKDGDYAEIVVSSKSSNGETVRSIQTFTVVNPEYEIKLESPSGTLQYVEPEKVAFYSIIVKNNGNTKDIFVFSTEYAPGWTVVLNKDRVSLERGASDIISLLVKAPDNAKDGQRGVVRFTSTSSGDAAKVQSITTITIVKGVAWYMPGFEAPLAALAVLFFCTIGKMRGRKSFFAKRNFGHSAKSRGLR